VQIVLPEGAGKGEEITQRFTNARSATWHTTRITLENKLVHNAQFNAANVQSI
jgi:hypothetical protein